MSKLLSACGLGLVFFFVSCSQPNPEKFAKDWTSRIKERILKESAEKPDEIRKDTLRNELVFLKQGRILKVSVLTRKRDSHQDAGNHLDTAKVIYYSSDQNFQYVVEPCIAGRDRSSECVAYKGDAYGFCQFYYCKKKTKETGFQFQNNYVGSWVTYDSTGKVTQQINSGNTKQLLQLKDLSD